MKNKYLIKGIVQEMSANPKKVPFSKKVDYEKLIDGDKDPMFVTLEVLNPGVSANKRRWTHEMMQSVAKQINEKLPDGYMGHVKPEDRMSVNPESVTMWVGAKIVDIDGTPRLLAKGYILPYAKKLRTYLKKALSSGKKVAVSVYGEALQKWNRLDKVYDISQFDLESIDWARSGSEGVKPALVPVIAQETKEEMEVILQEATLEQLKELRPDLVDALKEEFKTPEEPQDGEVKEMRTILGLGEEADVIQEMKNREEERELLLDSYMDNQISTKIGRESIRPVFKKMVISEMEGSSVSSIDKAIDIVLESDEGKLLIQEMSKDNPVDNQEDNRNKTNPRKFTKV